MLWERRLAERRISAWCAHGSGEIPERLTPKFRDWNRGRQFRALLARSSQNAAYRCISTHIDGDECLSGRMEISCKLASSDTALPEGWCNCHAEGRGFESHQPLRRKPARGAGFRVFGAGRRAPRLRSRRPCCPIAAQTTTFCSAALPAGSRWRPCREAARAGSLVLQGDSGDPHLAFRAMLDHLVDALRCVETTLRLDRSFGPVVGEQ